MKKLLTAVAAVCGMMSMMGEPALAQDMSDGAANFYTSKDATM